MNKTSKNNILIIGVSDISIYILESLLNCNKNYNITLICDQKISEKKLIEVKKFSNLINIIPEILPESNIFKSKEYANNLLTICASNDFKINILYSAMFKSRTKNDNLFCYINKNKYENLFNKKEIRIFNSWNIPSNLSSFWK
ncbi:MAG: hypothetical protein CL730_02545 [Chloroflexi bacterium]|nr:hypothetical protein [Chloroflexota bacterium]|tara:strand:+ start:316 stop:744 length:429 start_codon:yes stop_codon:yes gene_type:complete